MEYSHILSFIFIALLLVISPGPNGLLIAKTVPISGKKAGFANVLGFVTAFIFHGSFSILGLSVLLMSSAEAFFIVKILGAIYLAWIGVKSLISAFNTTPHSSSFSSKENTHCTLKKSFFEGLITNILNPKVSMFYLAAFPQFIPEGEHSILHATMLVSLHAIINFLWFSIIIILFGKLTNAAKSNRFQQTFKSITGIFFIGFGAKLLFIEQK